MTATRIRTAASHITRAAALAATLTLAACAATRSHVTPAAGVTTAAPPNTAAVLAFDNEAPVAVTVSLVGERREWRLGRVAAGARTTLRIPAAADTAGVVQLVVRADPAATLQPTPALRGLGAAVTTAQPLAALREQRWTFSQRRLAAPTIFGAPAARVALMP